LFKHIIFRQIRIRYGFVW